MKIFKFGGASIKDAESVVNVGSILTQFFPEKIIIVVSAMGKTTNALEIIANKGFEGEDFLPELEILKNYHLDICNTLKLTVNIDYFIDLIIQYCEGNRHFTFPQYYDQVVSIGELISSTILSNYLNTCAINSVWFDIRNVVSTDYTWREANINWEVTANKAQALLPELLKNTYVVTQGFIGGTVDGFTTTLGREGSDYTGAILANILQAEGLWIWKDVPGVLSADPKLFLDAKKIPELTYYEATEMTYNGAQVIHPKTIYPLRQKKIPLYVKSFLNMDEPGTVIAQEDAYINYPPIIVIKKNQLLISIIPSDLSFVSEEHLKNIYSIFAAHHVKINLAQIAAQTVSLTIDFNSYKTDPVLNQLKQLYKVRENNNLELLSVRHFTEDLLKTLIENKKIYLELRTRNSAQFLYE